MNIIDCPSPNFDSREGHVVDMLVLHYTGMKTGDEAKSRLCDPAAKVSAHYMVEEDGTVFRLIDEQCRAWHAGLSSWRGHTNINQRSIGIEIVNPGHEFGYRPFPKAQMEAVAALCRDILSRHPIPKRNVVAHSDIAPLRKEDPGELFDWEFLAKRDVGLWPIDFTGTPDLTSSYKTASVLKISLWQRLIFGWLVAGPMRKPDMDKVSAPLPSYGEIQKQLAEFGYACPQTGVLDEETKKTILAFQRHFYPERLTGQWDRTCRYRLAVLLSMV